MYPFGGGSLFLNKCVVTSRIYSARARLGWVVAPTENNAKGPSVLLIDSNQMRRAGIASLLAAWAGPLGIAIREASPGEILREFEDDARWQLVLLSVGGESISHGEYGTLMRVLPALAGSTPLVVIADNEVADEILVAYRCGCGGYVPTSMDPRLALQALGFIMNGGFFFPPSALRLIEGSGDDPDDAGTPGPGRVRRSISITARSEVREMPGSNGEPRTKSRPKRNIVETELEDAVSENGLDRKSVV